MELWQLGIAETTAGYRDGKFTPEDVLDETLERLSKVNPILNAVVTGNEPEARQLARQSTQR